MKKSLYIAAVAALLFSVSSQAQYRRYTSYFSADSLPDAERDRLLRRAKPLMPDYLTLADGRLTMTPQGWLVSNAVLTAIL